MSTWDSIRNATWACFDCRRAVRRPKCHIAEVPCPRCGGPCVPLGDRLRVPTKDDARAWRKLRPVSLSERKWAETRIEMNREHRWKLVEGRVAALRKRPASPARELAITRIIRQLNLS